MTCRLKKIATVLAILTLVTPNLALAGNEPSLDLSKASGLAAKQQYSEAIELYTAILDGDSPSTEDRGAAYYLRGIAEQEIGMTGHAIADFTQAIWLGHLDNKELATAHYRRGKGYALLKQYSRAITDFDRAIQLEPSFAQAYSERGDAYRNRGIYKLALQDYSTSIRLLNPDLHIPYFGRGLTHEAMGNERLATADFRRASELEPEFASAKARLAKTTGIQLAATGSIEVPTAVLPSQQIRPPVDEAETAEPISPTNKIAKTEETDLKLAQLEGTETTGKSAKPTLHAEEKEQQPPVVVERSDPAEVVADAGEEQQNLKHTAPEGEARKAEGTSLAKEIAANEVASETIDEEATGAIPDADREVTATAIREKQTADATEKPKDAATANKPNQVASVDAGAKSGNFLVQIASYREKDDALRRFDNLSAKHQDLFADLSPDILRADLGDKGIYYRLRIGPFQSFQGSTDLCNALKERQLDCLVIKRKSAG